ncbi:hypothetical protein [Limnoglobus roseus]|uniref:Uncharacterized protein n=1 Tax=Limnoglobus roseus TaxID=2598579 RepID=A0A5C1A7P3_9BACT|nr:hypothetical protein [Limnoglobus roseus]QEL14750.1 hypothetical protein PX52LOC_01644 [Limnoglobus roseus]
MVAAFIRERGVSVCPPKSAAGTNYTQPTVYGYGTPESFVNRQSVACNEENLAKAKILTMLQDLGGRGSFESGKSTAKQKLKDDAHRWFFNPRERRDFESWCETAGYDPDYVREQAQNILDNGLPAWRAEAGSGKRYEERRQYRERVKQRSIE